MDLLSTVQSPDQMAEELLQFVYLMPVAIARFGVDGRVDMLNPKAVQLLHDLDVDVGAADGPMILEALSPGLGQTWRSSVGEIGPVLEPRRCSPLRPAGLAELHLMLRLVRTDDRCTMLSIEDVTTVVEQEREIVRQRRRLELVLEQIHGHCVQMIDVNGDVIEWNPSIGHLLGCTQGDVVGKPLLSQVAADVQKRATPDFKTIEATIDRQGWCRLQAPFRRAAGPVLWGDCVVSPLVETTGVTCGYVAVIRDVTEEHHRTQRLMDDALTDPLTRLYNRRGLERCVADLLERHGDSFAPQSWIMVDIDHFKRVNDTYGHDGGDVVLQSVADALQGSARSGDSIARFGGEEFALLLPETSAAAAVAAAERMRLCVEALLVEPLSRSIQVTASFGVAQQSPGESWTAALDRADAALYKAKHEGRNRVVLSGAC